MTATSTERRDLGVDLVRGVALVSMYVAHCAPGAGPAHVLILSEYLTMPLFVRRLPSGGTDDGWGNVVVLVAGSLTGAVLWRLSVGRGRWSRGPVEGGVAAVVG